MSKPFFTYIEKDYNRVGDVLKKLGLKKLFIVCGRSFDNTKLKAYFSMLSKREGIELIRFSDYTANPEADSVYKAKALFLKESCQGIIAVGGGSATDLSKYLRLLIYREQSLQYGLPVPFFVIPTIAGSGSEVTSFAVIYEGQEKLSVSHEICMPEVVFYDSSLLETLSLYQRSSALLDAFCHCIESLWSVNSTSSSILYAESALKILMEHKDEYILNLPSGNKKLQKAARYAGMAINISKTTAAHAMSYKITKLFGIPHGISAGLCLQQVWKHIIENKGQCRDVRGEKHLELIFDIICKSFECNNIEAALQKYVKILKDFELPKINIKSDDLLLLANSVNTERLNNFPVPVSSAQLKSMYEAIIT